VDNRSYEEYISKYVMHINALIKGEKIKNNVVGKFEDPDKYFIKEFESNIHLKEDPEQFRSHILSRLGAYSLDNPGKEIIYTDVLDSITKLLKESFRNEQKKIISSVGKSLMFYLSEFNSDKDEAPRNSGLSDEGRAQIENILSQLHENYGYSKMGAINCMKYLLKKRYDGQ
jgi:predicted Ser/Thr protein kinase